MENASKALLIAGAVLIVILLIGIGMLIYSKSTGVVQTASESMSAQEIQAFNSKFTIYEGTQKGSAVKRLLATVIAHNANYTLGSFKTILITNNSSVSLSLSDWNGTFGSQTFNHLSNLSAAINDSDIFTVTLYYGKDLSRPSGQQNINSGLIYKIEIK